ncbi:MAG: DUF898 family protein [Bacteriovoracaceae bacterium]|nr:DUF898 family protein [Bacteriovoracaceae bacterium]
MRLPEGLQEQDEVSSDPYQSQTELYQNFPLAFDGNPYDLLKVTIKNTFLTILTLGLYSPHAKTIERKYLWHHLQLNDDRFHYSGTGKELFRGYIVALGVYALYFLSNFILGKYQGAATALVSLLLAIGIYWVFIPFTLYSFLGYLGSRTKFRNICFRLKKDKRADYMREYFRGICFSTLSFGLYVPRMQHNVSKLLINNLSYGNLKFKYT